MPQFGLQVYNNYRTGQNMPFIAVAAPVLSCVAGIFSVDGFVWYYLVPFLTKQAVLGNESTFVMDTTKTTTPDRRRLCMTLLLANIASFIIYLTLIGLAYAVTRPVNKKDYPIWA